MAAVDVVRCLSSFVWAVKQASVFGVPQKQLGQLSAASPDGDMEGRVTFLRTKNRTRRD